MIVIVILVMECIAQRLYSRQQEPQRLVLEARIETAPQGGALARRLAEDCTLLVSGALVISSVQSWHFPLKCSCWTGFP